MFLLSALQFSKGQGPTAPAVILVAEDEVMVRNIVCLLLQQEGHEVLSAADGHEALEVARQYQGHIDLLLTDVKMPRLDGLSLAERIIRERPGIRVLIMSGQTSTELRDSNIRLPFLRKPFVSSVFRDKVRQVLSGPPAHPQEI